MVQNQAAIEAQITQMVRRIVRRFHPDQVILFGSQARGDTTAHSDVDLLVVMEIPGSKREQQLKLRMALPRRMVPVDVIVTRPGDFAWRKEVVGTIEWPAHHEGKVLYARK